MIVLALFAMITLFLSSSVIFDWFEIRAKEGNYVLFIVWANFISSLLYLATVCAFFKSKKWMAYPLIISAVILIVAQIGLHFHIDAGGIYELKTVKAMYFRIAITAFYAVFTFLVAKKINNDKNN